MSRGSVRLCSPSLADHPKHAEGRNSSLPIIMLILFDRRSQAIAIYLLPGKSAFASENEIREEPFGGVPGGYVQNVVHKVVKNKKESKLRMTFSDIYDIMHILAYLKE